MNFRSKLIVEVHSEGNIYIAYNDEIPSVEIDGCPKAKTAELLEAIIGYKINPYELDWLTLELSDISYNSETKTAYIFFVCRVPEKIKLKEPYTWKQYSEIKDEIERIRGLF